MKCPFDGTELFPYYKGRVNSWKCSSCSRWFVGKRVRMKEDGAPTVIGAKTGREKMTCLSKSYGGQKEGDETMSWEEKVAGKVNFNQVGKELIGRITEVKPVKMPNAVINSYTMVTEDGETVSFLGTTVLDRLIGNELSSLVKIEYLGIVPTGGGRKLKNFRVQVWREPPKEEKEVEGLSEGLLTETALGQSPDRGDLPSQAYLF